MGDLKSVESPLVRVQTQSILQDTLGINELGKNWSIRDSLKRISNEGTGLFVLINYKDAKVIGSTNLKKKKLNQKQSKGYRSRFANIKSIRFKENYCSWHSNKI